MTHFMDHMTNNIYHSVLDLLPPLPFSNPPPLVEDTHPKTAEKATMTGTATPVDSRAL